MPVLGSEHTFILSTVYWRRNIRPPAASAPCQPLLDANEASIFTLLQFEWAMP